MNTKQIIVIAIAGGSAITAAFLAKGYLAARSEPVIKEVVAEKIPETEVLVAARDIPMGEQISQTMLKWQVWPESAVTSTMVTKSANPGAFEEYNKSRAMVPLYQGDIINNKKLIKPDESGFMSALLPQGMRAISIAVSEKSSAGGFILPNDRVDIILSYKDDKKNKRETLSETVITNVRVLAINQVYIQNDEGVTVPEGKTATLELTPIQAEILVKIEAAGELSLALRSIADVTKKTMDLGPQLAEKYTRTEEEVREPIIVKYGIPTTASAQFKNEN